MKRKRDTNTPRFIDTSGNCNHLVQTDKQLQTNYDMPTPKQYLIDKLGKKRNIFTEREIVLIAAIMQEYANELQTKTNNKMKPNFKDNFGLQTTFNEVVMLVSEDQNRWYKRVVFAFKNGRYIAWSDKDTLEQAKGITYTTSWKYAKPLDKVNLTKQDISNGNGVGVLPELIEIVEG